MKVTSNSPFRRPFCQSDKKSRETRTLTHYIHLQYPLPTVPQPAALYHSSFHARHLLTLSSDLVDFVALSHGKFGLSYPHTHPIIVVSQTPIVTTLTISRFTIPTSSRFISTIQCEVPIWVKHQNSPFYLISTDIAIYRTCYIAVSADERPETVSARRIAHTS